MYSLLVLFECLADFFRCEFILVKSAVVPHLSLNLLLSSSEDSIDLGERLWRPDLSDR